MSCEKAPGGWSLKIILLTPSLPDLHLARLSLTLVWTDGRVSGLRRVTPQLSLITPVASNHEELRISSLPPRLLCSGEYE